MNIGAFAIERDHSHYTPNATKTVLAVIGTASKGEINKAVVCTSAQDLYQKFGPVKPGYYGLYAANYFLSQSSKVYFVRAASAEAKPATFSLLGLGAEDSEGNTEEALGLAFLEKGTYYNDSNLLVHVNRTTIYEDTDFTGGHAKKIEKINEFGTVIEARIEPSDIYLEDPTTPIITETFDLILKSNQSTIVTIKELDIKNLEVGQVLGGYLKVTNIHPRAISLYPSEYFANNGSDGLSDDSLATAAAYVATAEALRADTLDLNIIATPGISDPAVISKMLEIAEARGDCLYLVDPPAGLTRDGVINWRNGAEGYSHGAFNSSYGALYYDWVNIYDSVNQKNVQVPPSVVVAATYAYSDRISEIWFAPAGLTRGLIRGAIGSVTQLNKSDIAEMYGDNTDNSNGINAIYDDPQFGLVLWGQKTLSRTASALNRVNVRRLLNYLKRIVVSVCNQLTFEPNDRMTWNSFEMKVKPLLESVKTRRGIYEYRIVRGESIVTDNDIDNYSMPCMILIRPTKAAEEIPIYFTITNTGANFNEVLDASGVASN